VPESFSVYKPSGAFCGEFAATGNAPGTASLLQHVSAATQVGIARADAHSLYELKPF
jgi:hypothetical protein